MFRGTGNTEPNPKHLGAGSIIGYEGTEWLLVATSKFSVNMLNMKTFVMDGKDTNVEDIYHISSKEFDSIRDPIALARSDYDYNTAGLKK